MKLFDFRLLATRTFGILCICLLAATAVYPPAKQQWRFMRSSKARHDRFVRLHF